MIDCGISNVGSVRNAFGYLDILSYLAFSPDDLRDCSHIVLPGDGSFPLGMRMLRESGLDGAIHAASRRGIPLLGICLGMQLLAERGEEFGTTEGLGLTSGHVERMAPDDPRLPVPQIGWNDVRFYRETRLSHGLGERAPFYFMQSYAFADPSASAVAGVCDYGGPVVALIEQGHLFGVQFHPEKSQRAGLTILKNFAAIR
ncbi:MAG TPA: imidazole glycerol phosphate synthase subunit HisH [Planctomycetaceae bacterium]